MDEDYRVAEIGAYVLDWMGTNKATWESAKDVWHMLAMWCGFDLPVFSRVKAICVAWFNGRAKKIEMCRNGCVAFWNATHPSMQDAKYQNAGNSFLNLTFVIPLLTFVCQNLTSSVPILTFASPKFTLVSQNLTFVARSCCPVCFAERWINGVDIPAKTFWYLPLKFWLQDLWRQKPISKHLANDKPGRPGSIRRSRGYQDKVCNNPRMNTDHRNLGLVATADGIPCFKDKNARSVIPCMTRTVMDEELGLNLKYNHLWALVPNYYSDICKDTGRTIRIKKKTSFLTAATTVLADELLWLGDVGCPCVDESFPPGSPQREFNCKVILLYW